MTPAILVPRRTGFEVEATPPFALSTNAAGADPGSGFGSTETIKWSARRAASQLRDNLMRMHELSLKFKERDLSREQKHCLFDLQKQALAIKQPLMMNSLDQSDAEEALAEWMESANIENAWKMAPTLVSIGMTAASLERFERTLSKLASASSWRWSASRITPWLVSASTDPGLARSAPATRRSASID